MATEPPVDILEEKDVLILEEQDVPLIVTEEVHNLCDNEDSPFRKAAEEIKFPLSNIDIKDLAKLILRFDAKTHISGLSAPQLGINKRAIVLEVKEGEDEKPFEKSLWINPTYKAVEGAALDEDYEVCYSVLSNNEFAVGPVFRLNHIWYRAYEADGRIVEGEAHGYLARVIQHEIDHLDGRVFTDFVQPERLLPLPEYVDRLQANTLDEMQKGLIPENCQ